jgi:GxxExxY protein
MNRQDAKSAKHPEPDKKFDHFAAVVVDAALEVHRHLGPGFLESVYEEALAVELGLRRVAFERQVPIALTYKQVPIGQARLDLRVGGCLVVELKAAESLLPIHLAQVLSYLKATRQPLGLLINFNVGALRQGIKRVVRTP